ncbi:MAG: 5'-nucleotidase C-terminal domain-containing protein, partial [Clostridia bacterium]|nr:5'-nucleotidase C-terminal domain-containing protein [Clostridia bacterium]
SYLRTEVGCDVVVVATQDYNEGINEGIASLRWLNAIDAIFCAHTHQNITEQLTRNDFKKIPVVQCNHKNQNLKEVVLKVNESGAYSSATIEKHYPSNYDISARVQAVINKYQDVIADSQKVLTTTQYGLSSGTLGGYATDLMLNNDYAGYNFGEVDVSIINTGGVRAEIDAGEITKAEVFEVFPFNNAVVLVNISGALIKSICSQNSNYLYYQVSSSLGGNYYALNDNTIYQLAVIDYVFENTRYDQFDNISASDYVETDVLLRDLLLEYFDESTEDDDVTPPDDGGGDVTPPAETIETVTIAEFYADFDSFKTEEVKVSGVAYSCDSYGIFIKDSTGNLYLKTSYTGLYMGQTITATGTANAYYSMPQMMVNNLVYGATGGTYAIPSTITPISQIIAENASQSSMVTDHKVYRTSGVLTKEGDYYNLVDGTNKIQIKSSISNDEYDEIKAYVDKEIALNIVIGDCFTTTGIFRFVSLRNNLNLIEVEDEEPEDPIVPEDPNVEPARIETTIAALVANVPELDQAVIYVTTATWVLENASNATTYGNGWLRDSLGNEVEVYGLCSSDSVVSWGSGSYNYYNNKSYAASGVADGDTIKVGMLYSLPYDNYKCFLIEIINDDDEPAGVQNAGVNFVMINDTHGALLDSSEGYSLGRVDTLITALENSKGDQIFIHGGDAFQGSYVVGENYGLSMIEAFNAMELDCFVLGNHEFDWGLDKIAQYADGNTANGEANFPFLGANIYYAGTTTRPDWIKAYHIVEQEGVRVGIIGIMEDGNETSILTSLVKDYDFASPLSIIGTTAAELRNNQGCDVVVVAIHGYQEAFNTSVAQLTGASKIDAIFCAHTHQNIGYYETRSDSKQIPVVQCWHKNNNLAEVILNVNTDGSYVDATYSKYSPGNYSISTRVQTVINKYQDVINDGNSVIGNVYGGLSEAELGAHATEAMLNYNYSNNTYGDIDITIINTGGVRASIDSGDITKAEVYEVFPFNNVVVIVNMSGALLKSLYGGNMNYLYMDIDDSIGNYTNLDDDTIYQLAVVDYVFEGKYYDEFKTLDEDDYYYSDVIMRNLLIDYLDAEY